MMKPQSLQHFETFLAVAEAGGFTAAAKQLGVTKAAVSHAIRLLEASLQAPLFQRTTRSLRLTEEGKLLFTQCQRLKNELDNARQIVSSFNTSPTGTLRISCNPSLAETELLPLLNQYRKQFPGVSLEVITEERMPDLFQEQIDIVFGVNWPAPLDVVAKCIGNTRYVLCASPDYLKSHGTPKTLKALEQHRYLAHMGRSIENIITGLKKPMPLKIKPYAKLNDAILMKQCALQGWGIAQLHDYVVKEELAKGTLIEILQDALKPTIPLYVYYQKYRFSQPKVREFIRLATLKDQA